MVEWGSSRDPFASKQRLQWYASQRLIRGTPGSNMDQPRSAGMEKPGTVVPDKRRWK
jgi:hypothetical protein